MTNLPADKRAVVGAGLAIPAEVATTLARLIDEGTPVSSAVAAKCAPSSVEQLTRFAYPSGVTDLIMSSGRCHDQVAYVAGRAYRLSSLVAAYLTGVGVAIPASGGAFRPDVMGLPVRSAAATARAAGLTLSLAGAQVDVSAPGTVVLQYPAVDNQLGVLVAVHRSARCRDDQLAVQYLPGGAGAGNDFGTIMLRNTSAVWCELTGPIRLTGLAAAGATTTNVVAVGVSRDLELSPRASAAVPRSSPAADQLVAALHLNAGYRDDHDGTYCSSHWIVPKVWQLASATGTLAVANGRGTADTQPLGAGGLITCRGRFDAASVGLATS